MAAIAEPVRVAIIGTGKRSDYFYGPILSALPDVKLVAVWGRSAESAQAMGEKLGVPSYTSLEQLVRETAPQIGIVNVNYGANGEVGLMAVESGLNVLLETPIAHKLSEADAILKAAVTRGLKIEVSEQFYRRPIEQIKLKLIAAGVFGRIHTGFNDFHGHGYHGASVMRSYLGFDAKPIRVTGTVQKFPLMAYYSRLADNFIPRDETQEHGIIEFEGGQVGIFHWTSVGYDSPLRWWRSSRFLGEKGMGVSIGMDATAQIYLTTLAPGGEAAQHIYVERRYERADGGGLASMIAHTGDPNLPMVRWDNPFIRERRGHNVQWHDDEIGVASCVMSLVDAVRNNTAPSYGGLQARLDQEIIVAIRMSAQDGGKPISLPIDPASQNV